MSLNLLCTTKLGKCKLTGPLRVFNMNNELKCWFHDFAYLPLPNIWVFRIHSTIVYYISQTEFHLIDHIENLSMYFNHNNTICVIYVTEIFDKVGCYRHMLYKILDCIDISARKQLPQKYFAYHRLVVELRQIM